MKTLRTFLASSLSSPDLRAVAAICAALLPACSSARQFAEATGSGGSAGTTTSGATTSGSTTVASSSAASSGGGAGGAPGAGGSASGTGGAAGTGGSAGWNPDSGWTNYTASADTHKIYVSSSSGNDANDGMSPATAVKTIAAGQKLLRNGHPDWLLLKRGDSWNEAFGTWTLSGADVNDLMVVSYYGDMTAPRPELKTGSQTALYLNPNGTVNYVAVIGLHFYADARDPSSPTYSASAGANPGIYWLGGATNILLEDLFVEFYSNGVVFQGNATHLIKNVTLRRSVITDSWSSSGNSEGIYLDTVHNVVVEENVLDHNGWNVTAGGYRTIFNHNCYIQVSCSQVTFQRNISTRASSHGVQVRPGGQAIDNLLVANGLAMNFGITEGGDAPVPGGVTGEVAGNVMLESNDISTSLPRGYGLTLGNIQSATVHDNIIAHNASAKPSYSTALVFTESGGGIGLHNLTLKNDIVYDWQGAQFDPITYENVTLQNEAIQVEGPYYVYEYFDTSVNPQIHFSANHYDTTAGAASWFYLKSGTESLATWTQKTGDTSTAVKVKYKDPNRSMATYSQSIGGAGTIEDYLAQARTQARGHYRYEYTTEAALAYVRDGFTVVP